MTPRWTTTVQCPDCKYFLTPNGTECLCGTKAWEWTPEGAAYVEDGERSEIVEPL